MPGSRERAPIRLTLSEDLLGPAIAASWIGPLVALGARTARFVRQLDGRQIIIAISVPRRDFAATLIGCGWVLASPAPALSAPLDVLRELDQRTPIRIVTEREVIADYFWRLNEETEPPRVLLSRSQWQVPSIRALAVLPELDASARMPRPSVGSLGRLAGVDAGWDGRLAAPAADLSIVGTLTWLRDDLTAFVSREGESIEVPPEFAEAVNRARMDGKPVRTTGGQGSITDVLLPEGGRAATWFTRFYASARFAEQELPPTTRAVILDGAGAIKYLPAIESEVVICILDRSVADELAAELVVQLRNSRGEPVSLLEDVGWRPPAGVEALAFKTAL